MAEDFGFSDFKDLGCFLRDDAGSRAAGIPDGDRPLVVIDDCPEHVREFILIFRLHLDQARDRAQIPDIKKPVVRGAVVAGESRPVHAECDVEILQSHVVNDHVVGPLHEGAIDGQERLHALHGESAGKNGGVLLGDTHVEKAVRVPLGKSHEPRACRHGGGDGGDPVVLIGKIGERRAEKLGIRRGRRGDCLAGIQVEFSESVKFVRLFKSGPVAFAFLGQDVEDDRVGLGFEKFKCFGEEGGVVSVDRAVIPDPEVFENHAGGEQVFEPDFGLVSELAGAFSTDPLDELGGLVVKVGIRGIRHQTVEIFRHGPDIFCNRPFVVVKNDDQPLGRRGDVVQGLKADPAGEGRIARHADHMFVSAHHVAGRSHSERRGERCPRMTGTVAIVFALAAQKKPVESFVLADRREALPPAGQQLVDIALVADIKNDFVLRRLKNPVQRDS